MYNLSHLYIYDRPIKNSIDESIKLSTKSYSRGFSPSKYLLFLALMIKYGFNYNLETVKKEIECYAESSNYSASLIQMIKVCHLNNELIFNLLYEEYQYIDFLYDYNFHYYQSTNLMNDDSKKTNSNNNSKLKSITEDFYDGFYNN